MITNFIDDTRIDNRLPAILAMKKMSIRQLSDETGIVYTMIRDVYHGKRQSVKWETIDRICQVLGVDVGDLYVRIPEGEG
ncbi:MAG: helix-turn-helix transcriptional regulator [Anaerolineae bacterium]|nr:helix-turn-helix transcriptional regulator [Anaerolineae bacterium]